MEWLMVCVCTWKDPSHKNLHKHTFTNQDKQQTLKPQVNTPSYRLRVLVQDSEPLPPVTIWWLEAENSNTLQHTTHDTQRAHQIRITEQAATPDYTHKRMFLSNDRAWWLSITNKFFFIGVVFTSKVEMQVKNSRFLRWNLFYTCDSQQHTTRHISDLCPQLTNNHPHSWEQPCS